MGVRLTEDELNAFLEAGHTLIVSTIRKSGEPLMTPVWYVWIDGAFWIGTGANSAKAKHLRRDPRACCLVEEGEKWVDLKAVIAGCDAMFVEDEDQIARVQAGLDRKYGAFRMDRNAMPEATRMHYARERAIIRLTPRAGEIRSWYNRKLRFGAA
ncbi:MAG: pyridoxamine 5'-phosphate oxidase family protein [Sphingomonadaceae bacterium]|nr:pyridoxamine 5'-phosphate oxidase family protein [Sphingomonadaceae bacterium]